jgi:hypothetical protein
MLALVLVIGAQATDARSGDTSSANAKAARLHSCTSIAVRKVDASRIRTDYRCAYARAVLRRLLSKGLSRLPQPKPRSGKWGCVPRGLDRVCKRYLRKRRAVTKRIVFRPRFGPTAPPTPVPAPPPAPSPPDPVQACVERWNADVANYTYFGQHLYNDHGARRVWVFQVPTTPVRCAVIAAVPETDPEFGNAGEVSNASSGWSFMNQVPEIGDPVTVQRQAGTNANASLQADGRVVRP